MKSKVLDRPMFKKMGPPVPPEEADNVGIMQGFMEALNGMEDSDMEEDDDSDVANMLDRRPDSPEILMNNLRGDMRSVDARVEELADLVGYRAASETPTEVLALLQPVLAQQGQMAQPPAEMMGAGPAGPMAAPAGGVADLAAMAQGPQTMPPEGMAPEAMPPEGMPPGGIASLPAAAEQQAPVAMRKGGIVQHFQEGSGEEGVTPVDTSGQQAYYPPELVARAQEEISNLMSQRPMETPSLESAMRNRLPMYERLLGPDKQAVQAQMLFDIASGALNVAAGVDAEGRPIRGGVSPVGRFAAGMKNVPAMIGARAGELSKAQREAKLVALQAGEKDIAVIREYNYKLVDSQRKLAGDIVKAAARGTGFGSGVKGAAWGFVTRFAPDYAAGKLTPEQDRRYESSYAIISEPTYYADPLTGNIVTRRPPIPAFITDSFKLRISIPVPAPSGKTKKGKESTEALPVEEAPPVAPVRGRVTPMPAAEESVVTTPGTTEVTPAPAQRATKTKAQAARPKTMWELTTDLTGPVPSFVSGVSSVPTLGGVGAETTQARTRFMGDYRELVKTLQNSPVYAQREMGAIEAELDLDPRFWDDPEKLRNKLIGIDNFLLGRLQDARRNATNENIPVDQRKDYIKIATAIENFRPKMGVPISVYTREDALALPKGTVFLWNGKLIHTRN